MDGRWLLPLAAVAVNAPPKSLAGSEIACRVVSRVRSSNSSRCSRAESGGRRPREARVPKALGCKDAARRQVNQDMEVPLESTNYPTRHARWRVLNLGPCRFADLLDPDQVLVFTTAPDRRAPE